LIIILLPLKFTTVYRPTTASSPAAAKPNPDPAYGVKGFAPPVKVAAALVTLALLEAAEEADCAADDEEAAELDEAAEEEEPVLLSQLATVGTVTPAVEQMPWANLMVAA